MVTGGDDLPVIALMVLGLALATRRRPISSGIGDGARRHLEVHGLALLLCWLSASGTRRRRRAILRYSIAAVAVIVPVLGLGIGSNWHAFVHQRHPLSPRAHEGEVARREPPYRPGAVSAVPGRQAGADRDPRPFRAGRGRLTDFGRWPPSSPQSAAGFSGLAMLLATLLAPATRFGYLIYPLDLLTCAVLFTPLALSVAGRPASDVAALKTPSGTSNSLSVSLITAEVCPSPASEGEIDGLTGVTSTPTSHS